jgi:hypothetical protein
LDRLGLGPLGDEHASRNKFDFGDCVLYLSGGGLAFAAGGDVVEQGQQAAEIRKKAVVGTSADILDDVHAAGVQEVKK